MKIGATALIYKNFEQASYAARSSVGQHDGAIRNRSIGRGWSMEHILFIVRASQNTIDRVHQFNERRRPAIARVRKVDGEVGVNMSGIAAENDNAIGENDSLF